jgi:hypothetical protein
MKFRAAVLERVNTPLTIDALESDPGRACVPDADRARA